METTCILKKSKGTVTRHNDIHYDKTITFSGPRDYYRAAGKAVYMGTEHKLCPNFDTMFSDTQPRLRVLVKKLGRPPEEYERWRQTQERTETQPERGVDVSGCHRFLFFRQPTQAQTEVTPALVRLQTTQVSAQTLPSGDGLYPQPRSFSLRSIMRKRKPSVAAPPPTGSFTVATKATQTDYRDSEAQTIPWTHDFICMTDQAGEVLTLNWLTLEEKIPPGNYEVTLIERWRQRQAWEDALPVAVDKRTDARRKSLVAMAEANDTAFRESEIESIHQLRIELSKKKFKRAKETLFTKLKDRLERLHGARREENIEKLNYMKHQNLRAMRKLHLERQKVNRKYHKWDIVSLHEDKTSELYAPQLRFGVDPSRRHETLDMQSRFIKRYRGFELLEERALQPHKTHKTGFNFDQAAKPKVAGMCARATTWTETGLQRLHSELKAIRYQLEEKFTPQVLTLRESLPTPGAPTPAVEEMPDWEDEMLQAGLVLSKTIKGRIEQSKLITGLVE